MGMRARERVLAEHTAECRAREFERIVSGLARKVVPAHELSAAQQAMAVGA
jgi:hypothetical protein